MKSGTMVELGDVADLVDYGVTASAAANPIGPKFLRITDIQNDQVDWESVPWCEEAASRGRSRLVPGDIVFARTGATTGKSFLVRECPTDSVFASYLIRVRLGEMASPEFVAHFFRSPLYWQQILRDRRGAAQPGVNATKLKKLQIPLPPLPEQQRIASILDTSDALRTKRRKSLELLDKLVQSVFLDMFGDPVANPKGWEIVALPDLATHFTDGPFGSNLKSSHYRSSGVRVIRLQNIGVGKILDDDLAFISEEHYAILPRNHCNPGDVLVATLGDPNLRAGVLPPTIDRALNKADCFLLRVDSKRALPVYVTALLNSQPMVEAAGALVRGQTRGRISKGRLSELAVPLPPLDLQERFADAMTRVECQNTLARSHLAELDTLFASLQSRAFRGEL